MKNLTWLLITLALSACGANATDDKNTTATVESLAARGLAVTISSVSLADDCGAATKQAAGACAADAAESGGCGSICQQSRLQLNFSSKDATESVPVRIIDGARLLDAATGSFIAQLSTRSPSVWQQAQGVYSPWDEQLAPQQEVQASYELSSDDWSSVPVEYNKTYVLEVEIEVDGEVVTIRSEAFSRAPQVAT